MLKQLDIHIGKKKNLDSLSLYDPTYKNLLRFIVLTLKARTIQLVEENIRVCSYISKYVHNLQLSKDFTDRTQKIITRKLINNRLYQNCKLLLIKGHHKENKKQATAWEKIFTKHA